MRHTQKETERIRLFLYAPELRKHLVRFTYGSKLLRSGRQVLRY